MIRTVHFPPKQEIDMPVSQTNGNISETISAPNVNPPNGKNALDSYREAWSDARIIVEKLKGLLISDNRHGDLQVARSACLRVNEELTRLIELEEA